MLMDRQNKYKGEHIVAKHYSVAGYDYTKTIGYS